MTCRPFEGWAPTAAASRRERASSSARRRWAIVQMFGAAMGVVLLAKLGMSTVSLAAVTLTCLCTTLSVLLFGSRAGGG